jgi:DNA-binding transcriptional ArsR family regulator
MTVHGEAKREGDPRVDLLAELADPLRLGVIDRLTAEGPATVSELASEAGVSMSQLSNHLRRLREAGLVRVERTGRQGVYEIADPGLEPLIPMLDSITGRVAKRPERYERESRTCYRHLAGPLGIELYRALLEAGAVAARPDGVVELGPEAGRVFGALGVSTERDAGDRRRFAFECLDWTERAPHLAGAMGDRVAEALVGKGWVTAVDGERTVRVTPAGARGLRRTVGAKVRADA